MNELYGRGAADTAPEPVRPEAPADAGRSGTADLPAEPAPPDQAPETRESADDGALREPQEPLKQAELDGFGEPWEPREPGTPPEPREPEAPRPSAAPDAQKAPDGLDASDAMVAPKEPGQPVEPTAPTEPAIEQPADAWPATPEPVAPVPWYATAPDAWEIAPPQPEPTAPVMPPDTPTPTPESTLPEEPEIPPAPKVPWYLAIQQQEESAAPEAPEFHGIQSEDGDWLLAPPMPVEPAAVEPTTRDREDPDPVMPDTTGGGEHTAEASPEARDVASELATPRGMREGLRFGDNDAAVAWVQAEMPLPELTERQYESLKAYTGASYGPINTALREGDTGDFASRHSEDIANIDAAFEKALAPESFIVHRGCGERYLTSLGVDPDDPDSVWELEETVQTEAGYWSTSVGSRAAFDGPVHLMIRVPEGFPAMNVMPLSHFGTDEREVLLGRDLHYVIHGVERSGGRWHIEAELVPPGWRPEPDWQADPCGEALDGYPEEYR